MSTPTSEFIRACDRAGVDPAQHDALWRLLHEWHWPTKGAEPLERLLEDHGHWRLYRSTRDGDGDAARRFEAYWRRAAATFLGRGFTHEQVEEFTALFFERVYSRAPLFSWSVPFTVYLRTILLNLARDEIRRLRKRRLREMPLADVEELPSARRLHDPRPTAEELLIGEERAAAVRRALDRLAPADRQILLRFIVDGESGEAIAASLGVGRAAVYQRLRRARERLRTLLDGGLSDRGSRGV